MSSLFNDKRTLPEDYIPCDNTVVIGRGKRVKNHEGNLRFVEILKEELVEYADINATRSQKSGIIRRVINRVRENSVGGHGFVKRDPKTGRWSVLEDLAARTSVGQGFRDLHPEAPEGAGGKKPQFKQAKKAQISSSSPTKDLSQMAYKSAAISEFSGVVYPPAADGTFSSQNMSGNNQGSMVAMSPSMFSQMFNAQRSSPTEIPNPAYSCQSNQGNAMPLSANMGMAVNANMAAPQQSFCNNMGGGMANYAASQQQSLCNNMGGGMALNMNMNMNMNAAAPEQNDDATLQRLLAAFGAPEDMDGNNPFDPSPFVAQQAPLPPQQNQGCSDEMSLFQALGFNRF